MSAGQDTDAYEVLRCKEGTCLSNSILLIGEEPLLIRINGKPYSVVMRTPGDEISHAAGFCLGEGVADSPDDFVAIGYCDDLDSNVVDIRLTDERQKKIPDLLERRGFVSQTSCGICGKELIKDLHQVLKPAADGFNVPLKDVFGCIKKLTENQNYYQHTRGSHAAIIFDENLNMISFAEDVGRHNALDKAIGKGFMDKTLFGASLLVLSSRISYELVQKAARAHIPVMISNSRPTSLAVQMGKALNMTLAFPANDTELMVVCGKERILVE